MASRSRIASAAMLISTGLVAAGASGYLRDAAIAATLGASHRADTFLVAYGWLDILTANLGLIFSAAVIPALSGTRNTSENRELATAMLILAFLAGATLSIAVALSSHKLVLLMGPGLSNVDKEAAARAMVIMTPGIAAVTVVAMAIAILSSQMRFVVPALAASMFNVLLAGGTLLVPHFGISGLSVAATFACLVQGTIAVYALFRGGLIHIQSVNAERYRSAVAQFAPFLPIATGVFISYSAWVVGRAVASGLQRGGLAELNYAFRISTTFSQVLGSGLATAVFPVLAAAVSRRGDFSSPIRTAVRIVLLISVPVFAFLIPWRSEVVSLLYQRGAFSDEATRMTADLMAILLVGFVADSLAQPIWRLFFALRRYALFLVINLSQFCANTVGIFVFSRYLGLAGIALAATLALGLQAIVLYMLAGRIDASVLDLKRHGVAVLKVLMASVPLGTLSVAVSQATLEASGPIRAAAMMSTGTFGGLLFLLIAVKLGLPEAHAVAEMARSLRIRLIPRGR